MEERILETIGFKGNQRKVMLGRSLTILKR